MAAVNTRRVLLGAVAGGVVWTIWTMIVNVAVLGPSYEAAQQAGHLLKDPRYPYFLPVWILTVFALSLVGARIYAAVRATFGPGPVTALRVGTMLGFAAGFPINFSVATWTPMDRIIPLWWTLDLWAGAILATFVAAWLYRE